VGQIIFRNNRRISLKSNMYMGCGILYWLTEEEWTQLYHVEIWEEKGSIFIPNEMQVSVGFVWYERILLNLDKIKIISPYGTEL
jgi:hypothetical protein